MYILIAIFFCINIFFILVFLEIIELNICNISYNTQKNIENRIINDKNNYSIDFDDNHYYSIDFDDKSDIIEESEEDILKNKKNSISLDTIN